MFWTDTLTERFKGSKKEVLVDDMATPSGTPHVGTLRGAIIHDVAAKAIVTAKGKACLLYTSPSPRDS